MLCVCGAVLCVLCVCVCVGECVVCVGLPRSNSIKVGRETTYDMSRLDGVNISDIRSSASQDDDIHYSITSRVAMASA